VGAKGKETRKEKKGSLCWAVKAMRGGEKIKYETRLFTGWESRRNRGERQVGKRIAVIWERGPKKGGIGGEQKRKTVATWKMGS